MATDIKAFIDELTQDNAVDDVQEQGFTLFFDSSKSSGETKAEAFEDITLLKERIGLRNAIIELLNHAISLDIQTPFKPTAQQEVIAEVGKFLTNATKAVESLRPPVETPMQVGNETAAS